MKKSLIINILIYLLCFQVFAQKKAWKQTEEINTFEAYQSFLQKHPKGKFADLALEKMGDIAYSRLQNSTDISALKIFVRKYPKHPNRDDIRLQLIKIKAAAENQARRQLVEAYEVGITTEDRFWEDAWSKAKLTEGQLGIVRCNLSRTQGEESSMLIGTIPLSKTLLYGQSTSHLEGLALEHYLKGGSGIYTSNSNRYKAEYRLIFKDRLLIEKTKL